LPESVADIKGSFFTTRTISTFVSNSAMSTPPHVIVIGAGLGGLCLAQGLKKAGVPVSLYERDESKHFRAQGYRLRVAPDGAAALRKTLSPEHFALFQKSCAQTDLGKTNINAVDGTKKVQAGPDAARMRVEAAMKNPNPEDVYGADRTTLRHLLMIGLEDNIHFGKTFDKYTLEQDGKVTARFTDGTEVRGDLLVGADGLHSPVRHQYLPDHRPLDTTGRVIYGKTVITPELLSRLPQDALRFMTVLTDATPSAMLFEAVKFKEDLATLSDGKLLSVPDYIYWVLGSLQPTFGMSDKELFSLSKDQIAKLSLKITEHWDPAFRAILELQNTEQTSALRISSFDSDMKPWKPSANVTLLGDAVHAMSPAAGAGANTALADGATLCEAIVTDGVITEATIGRYEEAMREYASKSIAASAKGGKHMFNQPPFSECKYLDA
jgi:2-polyprenyl-6-methoxyphenol hydroxylase-like FAD-dependent oxidoreductase